MLIASFPTFLHAQSIKAISFNIRYNGAGADDGEYAWEFRAPSVLKMIETETPDVMGLQEALNDQLAVIDNKFAGQYRRVGIGRDNGITEGEFMAIYYNIDKVELLDFQTRWLSETPTKVSMGWDAACKRTVTIAHFLHKASNKDFYYFNTHLDHVGEMARSESVKLLAKWIESMVPKGTAIILGGDMNSSIDQPIFQPLLDLGLIAARQESSKSDNKASYNAFGKSEAKTIDHFFVRGITLREFKTLDDNYGIRYISDHYPIKIVFRIK